MMKRGAEFSAPLLFRRLTIGMVALSANPC